MQQPEKQELRLLLACARGHTTGEDEAAIRALLDQGVDWMGFARKAVDHGLAALVGQTLCRLVPDLVPQDIQTAFSGLVEQTRRENQQLLEELAKLIELLEQAGVQTIPFKGPVLAKQAFGDLGLRLFRDLDLLIRDGDIEKTATILREAGYERPGKFTRTQYGLIHRLQGQEILFKADVGAVEPHTRFTSCKMALDIDYPGLWLRAGLENVFGHFIPTLTPEDTILVLAIHGGKELWWDIKWACDVADFIASHPNLQWESVLDRARKQGCYRMLLVATSLAHNYFCAKVPRIVVTAQATDRAVGKIITRILARWEMDDPGGPPSNKALSIDRFLLHDGISRRLSYVARTWVLPGPEHISLMTLPSALSFAYIPIGLTHDLVALPAYRAYQQIRLSSACLASAVQSSVVVAAFSQKAAARRKKQKDLRLTLTKTERAVTSNPRDNVAWLVMGQVLAQLGHLEQAIACYDKALLIAPDHNYTWRQRAKVISILRGRGEGAGQSDEPALDLRTSEGWTLRAGFLAAAKRFSDASMASDSALLLDPTNEVAIKIGIESRQSICDWSRHHEDNSTVQKHLQAGSIVLRPINFKQVFDSAQASSSLAHHWTKNVLPASAPLWQGERYRHHKIRIAYLSTDFRSHAVGNTIVSLLEKHDKECFDVTAISIGPNDNSRVRARIQNATDRFVDANSMTDAQAAALIREGEIDIAIDLNGLTGGKRTGILACRPAPVQVNYLGYPGTMAVPFIDYVIGDPVIIPKEDRVFYAEKIAYLPDCYLPYDTSRGPSAKRPSRQDQGLPGRGFVFACFNTVPKVRPEIFDVWMRLLCATEGSVFWLANGAEAARTNLRKEAVARGVAPERLVFACFEKNFEDHLARLSLADIFLDTTPYNAHSSGNDALWAGLPLLTYRGNDFQSRVAASLLTAVGLPELVASSLDEYERRALSLAREPRQLEALREKLLRNRHAMPLFDIKRYANNLESIYRTMWERQQAGLPPASFSLVKIAEPA